MNNRGRKGYFSLYTSANVSQENILWSGSVFSIIFQLKLFKQHEKPSSGDLLSIPPQTDVILKMFNSTLGPELPLNLHIFSAKPFDILYIWPALVYLAGFYRDVSSDVLCIESLRGYMRVVIGEFHRKR